jgi:hypothetical protein
MEDWDADLDISTFLGGGDIFSMGTYTTLPETKKTSFYQKQKIVVPEPPEKLLPDWKDSGKIQGLGSKKDILALFEEHAPLEGSKKVYDVILGEGGTAKEKIAVNKLIAASKEAIVVRGRKQITDGIDYVIIIIPSKTLKPSTTSIEEYIDIPYGKDDFLDQWIQALLLILSDKDLRLITTSFGITERVKEISEVFQATKTTEAARQAISGLRDFLLYNQIEIFFNRVGDLLPLLPLLYEMTRLLPTEDRKIIEYQNPKEKKKKISESKIMVPKYEMRSKEKIISSEVKTTELSSMMKTMSISGKEIEDVSKYWPVRGLEKDAFVRTALALFKELGIRRNPNTTEETNTTTRTNWPEDAEKISFLSRVILSIILPVQNKTIMQFGNKTPLYQNTLPWPTIRDNAIQLIRNQTRSAGPRKDKTRYDTDLRTITNMIVYFMDEIVTYKSDVFSEEVFVQFLKHFEEMPILLAEIVWGSDYIAEIKPKSGGKSVPPFDAIDFMRAVIGSEEGFERLKSEMKLATVPEAVIYDNIHQDYETFKKAVQISAASAPKIKKEEVEEQSLIFKGSMKPKTESKEEATKRQLFPSGSPVYKKEELGKKPGVSTPTGPPSVSLIKPDVRIAELEIELRKEKERANYSETLSDKYLIKAKGAKKLFDQITSNIWSLMRLLKYESKKVQSFVYMDFAYTMVTQDNLMSQNDYSKLFAKVAKRRIVELAKDSSDALSINKSIARIKDIVEGNPNETSKKIAEVGRQADVLFSLFDYNLGMGNMNFLSDLYRIMMETITKLLTTRWVKIIDPSKDSKDVNGPNYGPDTEFQIKTDIAMSNTIQMMSYLYYQVVKNLYFINRSTALAASYMLNSLDNINLTRNHVMHLQIYSRIALNYIAVSRSDELTIKTAGVFVRRLLEKFIYTSAVSTSDTLITDYDYMRFLIFCIITDSGCIRAIKDYIIQITEEKEFTRFQNSIELIDRDFDKATKAFVVDNMEKGYNLPEVLKKVFVLDVLEATEEKTRQGIVHEVLGEDLMKSPRITNEMKYLNKDVAANLTKVKITGRDKLNTTRDSDIDAIRIFFHAPSMMANFALEEKVDLIQEKMVQRLFVFHDPIFSKMTFGRFRTFFTTQIMWTIGEEFAYMWILYHISKFVKDSKRIFVIETKATATLLVKEKDGPAILQHMFDKVEKTQMFAKVENKPIPGYRHIFTMIFYMLWYAETDDWKDYIDVTMETMTSSTLWIENPKGLNVSFDPETSGRYKKVRETISVQFNKAYISTHPFLAWVLTALLSKVPDFPTESWKNLRTNLLSLYPDSADKVLLLEEAVKPDGKILTLVSSIPDIAKPEPPVAPEPAPATKKVPDPMVVSVPPKLDTEIKKIYTRMLKIALATLDVAVADPEETVKKSLVRTEEQFKELLGSLSTQGYFSGVPKTFTAEVAVGYIDATIVSVRTLLEEEKASGTEIAQILSKQLSGKDIITVYDQLSNLIRKDGYKYASEILAVAAYTLRADIGFGKAYSVVIKYTTLVYMVYLMVKPGVIRPWASETIENALTKLGGFMIHK